MQSSDLMAQLENSADEALHVSGIYEISSHGWLDADTMDPEMTGHALWQMSPPYDPDFDAIFNAKVPTLSPSNRQKQLVMTGQDFEGAMICAKRAIGLSLLGLKENMSRLDDAWFWFSAKTGWLWLNIAHSKVREFFARTVFDQDIDKFIKLNGGKDMPWTRPFTKAAEERADPEFNRLSDLMASVDAFRKTRNKIAHDTNSFSAEQSQELLLEQRKHADSRQPCDEAVDLTFEEHMNSSYTSPEPSKRQQSVQDLVTWYKTLAEASNLTFEIEHSLRGSHP